MKKLVAAAASITIAIAILAATTTTGQPLAAESDTSSPNVTWEYKQFTSLQEGFSVADLNKLGDEGWELVTATHLSARSANTTFIFKRPKR